MSGKIDRAKPGEILVYPEVERLMLRGNGSKEPTWVAIHVRNLSEDEMKFFGWKRFRLEEIYNCVGKEGCVLYLESHGLEFREIPFEPDWTAIVENGNITPFFRIQNGNCS